jgi:CRP/FNR family cyclic AMP-dependent transcriptional regulator
MAAPDPVARLADVPLFARVPKPDLVDLGARMTSKELPKGAVLFHQGDDGDSLYVIESGAVKVSNLSGDGREVVVALLGPGEVFGELAMLEAGVRTADATAIEDTTVLSLSSAGFRPFLEDHPQVAWGLLEVLAGRLRETSEALQDAIFSDVPGRLAKRFLDLAERYGTPEADGSLIDLAVTQEELAQMVGAARESVNKAVASFVSRGWLSMKGRKYVVTDRESLTRRAT